MQVRKLLAATLAVAMVALVVLSVPRVSAQPNEDDGGTILVSYSDVAFTLEAGHWQGTIRGSLRGTIAMYEGPRNFIVGDKEYFYETFVVSTGKGVVQGTDEGVYNLTTGDFWCHGSVTEASGHWAFLVGYALFEWGTTSTPGVFPMTGHDVPMILFPAQPGSADDVRTLVSSTDMAYSPDWGYWRGTMTGDVNGAVGFWEQPQNYVVGDNEYFFEAFTVTAHKGVLQGFDHGVYNLTTGDFWAFGQVTKATRGLGSLAGYTVFEWGTTSTPFVFPMIGEDVPFVLMGL